MDWTCNSERPGDGDGSRAPKSHTAAAVPRRCPAERGVGEAETSVSWVQAGQEDHAGTAR